MSAPPTRLPDFPASVEYLDRPQFAVEPGLRGQIVVLMFWRAGCVHSRQALAAVAGLARERVGRPFAVVAVHVPTFAPERDEARVRRASESARDAVTVAVDTDLELARTFGVTTLPWLLLVDGDGDVRFSGRGEPNRVRLAEAVDALLAILEEQGEASPIALLPVAPSEPVIGASAVASDGEHLWIAVPALQRVFAITSAGAIAREIDGFEVPAGISVQRGQVLVSDCGAHELRAIDIQSGEVSTVLGTGWRGTDLHGGSFGDQQPLSSPAGSCMHDGALYLAHAGAHQVWQFDPETQAATAWVGTGERSMLDGCEQATLAEPLAVAASPDEIFVADAGNDAVRAIELAHNFVRTIAQDIARPSALVVRGDSLFVAAAWAPAVVRMSLQGDEREVVCDADDGLVEPVGLAFHGDELWIADIGAAALFAVDLDATPPGLRRVALALPGSQESPERRVAVRVAEPIDVLEFSDVTLRIYLPTAAGEQLDCGASAEVDLVDERDPVLAADRHAAAEIDGEHVSVLVPIDDRGDGVVRVRVRATIRVGDHAERQQREFLYVVPVTVGLAGALEAEVRPAGG